MFMKRFFFLVVSLVLFANVLFAQKNDREFGVVVFYTKGKYSTSIDLAINNIDVISTGLTRGVLFHKVYSTGQVLIREARFYNAAFLNVSLSLHDTLYVSINFTARGDNILKVVNKEEAIAEIEQEKKERDNYLTLYSTERITYPYNPESFDDKENKGKRSGSGFLLSKDGYIVTNYHVIENTKKVTVRGVNSNKNSSLSVKVIYTDTINDMALLQLEDKISIESPVYKIRNTTCDVGESIYVLGYPLTTSMGEDIKLTDGLISSQNGFKGDTVSYQISAPVQPGNSGAPLFDKDGNIIGIVNAKLRGAENATYAIKVKHLMQAIDRAGVKLVISSNNSLAGKTLPQQVKAIQDFVYIIDAE